MTFADAPIAAEMMLRMANAAQYKDRTSGPPHVSDLTSCARKAWYRRMGVRAAPLSMRDHATLLSGQGHHVILQSAKVTGMRTEVHLQDDSIPVQGSADLILPDYDGENTVVEVKTTRASSKWDPEHWPHYVEQLGTYVLLEKARRGLLLLLHLMGDWKQKPPGAEFRGWDLRFPKAELQGWRHELTRRSSLVLGPEVPSLDEHADWECDLCPFNEKIGGPCEGGDGQRVTGFFPIEEM